MVRIKNQFKIFDTGIKSHDGVHFIKSNMFNVAFDSINKDKILNLIDRYSSDYETKEIYDLDCCVIKTKELKKILNIIEYFYYPHTDVYGSDPEIEEMITYLREYLEEE